MDLSLDSSKVFLTKDNLDFLDIWLQSFKVWWMPLKGLSPETFTCSKSIIETLEKGVPYVQS